MDYSDALAEMLKDGADSLWRGAYAMPADKIDWRPAPDARTTRELLEELVTTTGFSADLVRTQAMPEMAESELPKELAELERLYRANLERFIEAVKGFPAEKLHDSITLPWGTMNFLQVIAYPYWNLMYHWGQISYIQTMYGDKESH